MFVSYSLACSHATRNHQVTELPCPYLVVKVHEMITSEKSATKAAAKVHGIFYNTIDALWMLMSMLEV